MRLGNFLSLAVVPMLVWACSENSPVNFGPNPQSEEPEENPTDSIPPNTPDSLLKPITRDFSMVWSAGDGSVENPYQIATEQDLKNLAFYVNDSSMNFKDKYFKQTADIVLSDAWKPIGVFGSNPNGLGNRPFSGKYDGALHTISNLNITDTASYSGLFGLVRGATISNLVIAGAKMNVGSYAGALAGMADSTVIESCGAQDVEITGRDRVAGIVGEGSHVSMKTVLVSGSITGENSVAGVIGRLQDGALDDVVNKASVKGKSTVGGIAGSFATSSKSDGTIAEGEGFVQKAFNYSSVTGTTGVGGLFATLSNTKLEKSGNHGDVTADASSEERAMGSVGGAVAVLSTKSSMDQVYNLGKVTSQKLPTAGGVIGNAKTNVVATNLFNHGEVAGVATYMGGIVGSIESEAKLESSYNKGVVPNENYAGTLAGKGVSTIILTNVFFDKDIGGDCKVFGGDAPFGIDVPSGTSSADMKSAAFITQLGSAEGVWTIDATKYDGYPYFAWIP